MKRGVPKGEPWMWTPDVVEILIGRWGMTSARGIASILSTQTGRAYSLSAVYTKASALGLRAADAQGLICLSDAAAELDVTVQALHKFIQNRGLATKGAGRVRYLTDETWSTVKAFYQAPPEATMTLQEAARCLGRSMDWTYNQVRSGTIRAWKFGKSWRVSRQDVDRMRWDITRQRGRRAARKAVAS